MLTRLDEWFRGNHARRTAKSNAKARELLRRLQASNAHAITTRRGTR